MSVEDTIVAIATPLGNAGLGIVRVSGDRALAVAQSVFRAARPLADVPSHTVVKGTLVDRGETVDQALATVFHGPRSYTGEDVVELSCHGSLLLLKKAMHLCVAAGARLAEPGEFTRRAFTNGKMDLVQAEAVADLISAHSEALRRLSLAQLEGRLSERLRELREKTLHLLAHVEANLDFAEEEVPDLSRDRFLRDASALARSLDALLETAGRGRLLREGVRVALVGRPNAGKSSLFNALLGADRAIVTPVPGTTRDALEERVMLEDVPVVLTDTAGVRDSRGRVEKEGISRTRQALEQADVAVCVVDASQPMSPGDKGVFRLAAAKKRVVALNKSDLVKTVRRSNHGRPAAERWAQFAEDAPCVSTSAKTGQGLPDLSRAILGQAGYCAVPESRPGLTVVNARHESLLRSAAEALAAAQLAGEAREGEECLAVHLRRALACLDEITGRGAHDDILDAVFSQFCIGK
jgi:tRNA modification GTPase